jgi:hypothetical protein
MSRHESLASSRPLKEVGIVRRLRAKSRGSFSQEIENKCIARVCQLLEAGEGLHLPPFIFHFVAGCWV